MIDPTSISDYFTFGMAGLLGGLANQIVMHDGKLIFPKFIRDGNGNKRGVVLGFFGSILVGVVVALITDTNFLIALGGAFAGNAIVNQIKFKNGEKKNDGGNK
jgi:hypothetical protein